MGRGQHSKPKTTSRQGAAPAGQASARRLPWQGWSSRRWPPPGLPRQLQTWERPLTFGAGELAEGGQRDDGVGDGVHRVQHAGDVVGAAGLDAADGVCLLLAEPEGSHSTRGGGKCGTRTPTETEPRVRERSRWLGSSTRPRMAPPWETHTGLPAQLLLGDASGSFYKPDQESNPRDTPQFPSAPAKISKVLLFTSCMN